MDITTKNDGNAFNNSNKEELNNKLYELINQLNEDIYKNNKEMLEIKNYF